jgi:hypothetical protein
METPACLLSCMYTFGSESIWRCRRRGGSISVVLHAMTLAALSTRDRALATRRRTTLASDNKIFAYEYNYVLVPDNSILNVAFG